MASGLFCETFEAALKRDISLDLDTDTFKCLLTTASFNPTASNYETMSTMNDVTNELPASGGYTTGGKTLTGVTFASSSDGTGTLKFDAADVEWTIDDFERIRLKVPVICDLKYAMNSIVNKAIEFV